MEVKRRKREKFKEPYNQHVKVLEGLAVGKNWGRAMLDAGYSENYAKNPKRLQNTTSWQALIKQEGPGMMSKVVAVNEGLLEAKEWQARNAGIQNINKWLGLEKPSKSVSLAVKIDNSKVQEFLNGIPSE